MAPISMVHPLKRSKNISEPSTSKMQVEMSSSCDEEDDFEDESSFMKQEHHSTKSASKLVTKAFLSTNKTSKILQELAEEGINVPTPSQSGIWRRVIKDAEKVKNQLKEIIPKEEFCL